MAKIVPEVGRAHNRATCNAPPSRLDGHQSCHSRERLEILNIFPNITLTNRIHIEWT